MRAGYAHGFHLLLSFSTWRKIPLKWKEDRKRPLPDDWRFFTQRESMIGTLMRVAKVVVITLLMAPTSCMACLWRAFQPVQSRTDPVVQQLRDLPTALPLEASDGSVLPTGRRCRE